jgi:hypothetical protein
VAASVLWPPIGCAMAQVVGWESLTAEADFDSKAVRYGLLQMTWHSERFLSECLRIPLLVTFHQCSVLVRYHIRYNFNTGY